MSGHKIDSEFIGKLTEARIAAHKEVETNTYYGHTPEARMANFSAGIENGLGGDVGKYLGMLDPETVFLIIDELVVRRRRMRNIRTMADYDLGAEPAATETEDSTPVMAEVLEKMSKSPSAMVIPNPDVKFQVGDQWVGIDDFTEVRNVLGEWLESNYRSTVDHRRLTVGGLAREVVERFDAREAGLRGGTGELRQQLSACRDEVEHQKDLVETYKEAAETSNEAVKTSAETTKMLLDERLAIMERITDWENAYQGGIAIESDLTSRVAQLINAYGSLYQGATEADKAHRGQDELLREVDVLGAYLKYPVRETETDTRLEIVKAALTKIEEQDELIGTLQRALVAAQSGQPRRPRETTIKAEDAKQGAKPTETEQLVDWAKKVMVNADFADPKVTLDRLLQHMFGK